MTIAILCSQVIKEDILETILPEGHEFIWADALRSLTMIEADAWFDLEFQPHPQRIEELKKLPLLFIGSNLYTCRETGLNCMRINDWPGMLSRPLIEVSTSVADPTLFTSVLDDLGWSYQLQKDKRGFTSSRILAGIINEAFYTLEAGLSSREDIDIAMKLGTNYPYGPFEWAEKIGLENLYNLLKELSRTDPRYEPCPALVQQINSSN